MSDTTPTPGRPDPADAIRAATVARPDGVGTPARFVLDPGPDRPRDDVVAAVERDLAVAFDAASVTPFSALEHRLLVLELPQRVFGAEPADAFSAAYALVDTYDLAAAEPDLPVPLFPTLPPARPGATDDESAGMVPGCWVATEPGLPATWAVERIGATAAWDLSTAQGRPARGDGVVVAQPDTGVVAGHSELAGATLLAGFDVLDDDPDPTDPFDGGNLGHGTGTASVVVSPTAGVAAGSAPGASLLPIRAVQSVIVATPGTVAQAIDWAVAHGAQVVTMSLGGLPSLGLSRALARAVAADVIVLAAAGNCVRLVVWPARYDDCIAVAGTNAADGLWPGTCRGSAVDVAAPAQNVPRAGFPDEPGAAGPERDQGQGTSFAVALTAGVAALWLAHHGRANLVGAARSRGETLQAMFRRLLTATARRPAAWDAFEMGAGIVDASALLAADLDLGRGRESVPAPDDPVERAQLSVASLVAEVAGPEAVTDPDLDWHRFGTEIALAMLTAPRRRADGTRDEAPAPAVSGELAAVVGNPRLRDTLRLDDELAPESGATPR